jgi:Trypsin-like serine proteases, typically periplasmic, contain C-terminal PDZ domain
MKKRVFAIALVLVLLLSVSIPAFAAPTDEKTLRHSVVRIYVGDVYSTDEVFVESQWAPSGAGTGFFVGKEGENPQYIITNQHVVEYYLQMGEGARIPLPTKDGGELNARVQIRVYFDKDNYEEAYVVEAGDPLQRKDFAILRLAAPTDKRAALPICVPTQAVSDPNRKVITVGYPGSADNEVFKSTSISGEADAHITTGIVNKIFTETGTGTQILEFDAKINHGNSGGPLVLDNGAAIGVTTWGLIQDNQELYYAVGMETIKPYLDKNNIPYELLSDDVITPEPESTPEPEVVKPKTDWIIYAVLGVAILGIIVVLLVLLRKPKKSSSDSPSMPVRKAAGKSSRVLVGVDGPLKDKRYKLEAGQSLYIGRDKKKCKVLFPDKTPGVSGIHCKISFDGNKATITDLKSSYGTAVDGRKLVPNSPIILHRGLPIDIGSKSNRFTLQ